MATVFSFSTVAVATNGETFQTSNAAGFSLNSSSGAYGTADLLASAATTPASAYALTVPTKGYLKAAASRTQTVRLRLRRYGSPGSVFWQAIGRASSGGNDYIEAIYRFDNWQCALYKIVDGSRITLMTYTSATPTLADGETGELELRIVEMGTPGTVDLRASVWWRKSGGSFVQIGATQTVTDAQFDLIGQLGFACRSAAQTETTGVHLVGADGSDDTASAPTFAGTIPAKTGVAGAAFSWGTPSAASYFTGATTYTASAGLSAIGLSIDSGTGVISGTGIAGTWTGTITGANGTAPDAVSNSFSITVSASSTPVAFSGTVPAQTGTVGTASTALALAGYFSGSLTPFSYAVFSGSLPPGLSLNASTGQITGTPTTAGSYSAVVRATDTGSNTANTGTIAWTIAAAAATALNLTVAAAAGVTGLSGVVLSAAAPGAGVSVLKTLTAAAFDGAGTMSIDITGLGVTVGQRRWVALTQSNGDPAQSPAPWGASGPVTAS